ncbi:MAG: hypothetical protein AB1671_08600 [Thermodesulfobacteriota bacterium]|jgi:hypothetical protein
MSEKKIQGVEDLVTVYKTLFFDLPMAGAKWGLGIGTEKEATEAAWKGYDAAVRLSAATVDNFYRAPLFGEVMARSLDGLLRWQRLTNAAAGVVFPALWQAVGLPTAAETQALRAEVHALREELRAQRTGLSVKPKEQAAPVQRDHAKARGTGAVKPIRPAA